MEESINNLLQSGLVNADEARSFLAKASDEGLGGDETATNTEPKAQKSKLHPSMQKLQDAQQNTPTSDDDGYSF